MFCERSDSSWEWAWSVGLWVGLGFHDKAFEGIERTLPHPEVPRKPRRGGFERAEVRPQIMHAAKMGSLEQTRPLQIFQMFRHHVERQIERRGELGDATFARLQQFEHPPARGVAEREKDV